ncbi:MAG: A24 family peptidase [Psychromonas sp.]|nr:A24 family peptidase [Psychromonas sp.]
MMEELSLMVKLSVILLVFIIALYLDLQYQRIPNLLCTITLLTGLIVQSYFSGWSGLLSAFVGSGLAFIVLFPAFYCRLLGAGDVKLMVAVGSFLDAKLLLWSILYAIIAGALTSLVLALFRLGWRPFKEVLLHYLRCLYLRKYIRASNPEFLQLKVPYAPALALGWIWACSQNEQILLLISNLI